MSFSITDKRDFKREVRKIIDDLACDPCYRGGGGDCCNDGRTTLMYDGSVIGSWTANQDNDNVITIPKSGNANDGKTDLYLGDSLIGSWSANQSNNNSITIPEPPEPEAANDGKTNLYYGESLVGSWSANQVNNNDITIPEPEVGNGRVSITVDGEEQGSFTVNQKEDTVIELLTGGGGDCPTPLTETEIRAIMVD